LDEEVAEEEAELPPLPEKAPDEEEVVNAPEVEEEVEEPPESELVGLGGSSNTWIPSGGMSSTIVVDEVGEVGEGEWECFCCCF
jgi:hypothetical protein